MLFIKSLPETTRGADIFDHIMQYFNDKGIPLTNLIYIASDGAKAMTGKVKGFVFRMKASCSSLLSCSLQCPQATFEC